MIKKTILPIVLASVWISISEFVRNTFLLHSYWLDHYKNLGITFPEQTINGAIWGLWSLVFASVIFILAKKFTLIHTTILSWIIGFGLMWLVIGNLGVLPTGILILAFPLKCTQSFLPTLIIKKLSTDS